MPYGDARGVAGDHLRRAPAAGHLLVDAPRRTSSAASPLLPEVRRDALEAGPFVGSGRPAARQAAGAAWAVQLGTWRFDPGFNNGGGAALYLGRGRVNLGVTCPRVDLAAVTVTVDGGRFEVWLGWLG